MKSLMMSIVLGMMLQSGLVSAAPVKQCFGFQNGKQEITVGWFSRKTYVVNKMCVEGNYKKMGHNSINVSLVEAGYSSGRDGAVVSYKASLERFSSTQARFTISDGEPEPTQWEASFNGNTLVSVQFERGTPTGLVPVVAQ